MRQTTTQAGGGTAKPAWLAPAIVLIIAAILVMAGRKKREAVENPLVDLTILTVGVFAFAAAFRWVFTHLGAPGAASFFGAPAQSADTY